MLAVVLSTSFYTVKGSLILSILFPQPSSFHFTQASYRFIGVMAVVAVIGFIISIFALVRTNQTSPQIALKCFVSKWAQRKGDPEYVRE